MIETRLLQYFLAVAEEQSITKAADYLHITQPTLSKQLIGLEKSLGKKLLIRGKRKVTLTEEGAFLRNRAQEIISLMEKTEASFQESDQMISGDIFIGCGEHRAMLQIMNILKRIQIDFPEIHFHIFSGTADDVTERLDKGLLDVGFLLEPAISPRYDYQRLPLHEEWGVLMRKDSSLAKKEFLSLEDISKLPMIFPSQTFNSDRFTSQLNEENDTMQPVATFNLIYNAGLMVEAGIGYAMCLENLVSIDGDSPLAYRPLYPVIISNVYMLTKKYQFFSKATQLFLNRLPEELVLSEPGR